MAQESETVLVPVSILRDGRLTKTDLRVLVALHWLVGRGQSIVSRAALADLIGLHPTKVSGATAHLKKLGLLDKKDGRFTLLGQEVAKPATCSRTSYENVAELATKKKPNQLQVAEPATSSEAEKHTAEIREVIDHLNQVTQSAYTACESNAKHIRARLNDGMTVEDLKTLTSHQAQRWLTDPEMSPYLRPQTLYGTKAQGYLSAAKRVVAPLPYSEVTAQNIENLRSFVHGN